MIQDISRFGVFYPSDSLIHRLDPRTKLAGTFLYVISLFFPMNPYRLVLAGTFLVMIILLARASWSMVLRGIKPIWPILVFTALMNLLFTKGEILWKAGPFTVTKEGLGMTVYLITRLVFLVAGSSILMLTTSPKQVADGLERSLHFLTRFKVPVHECAMMMSIAMRFIPILSEEFDRIRKAQMSRGADFEEGNLIVRAKKTIPILVPLFVSAIRRAGDLALAMDARCYNGGDGRTKLHPLKYGALDYRAYGCLLIYMILMAGIGFIFA